MELIVGLPDDVPLTVGGRDLDNYLNPVARRLGPPRIAAMFGRKIHGPSSLAVGLAQPDAAMAIPQFSTRHDVPESVVSCRPGSRAANSGQA